jgi:hypothetical protein
MAFLIMVIIVLNASLSHDLLKVSVGRTWRNTANKITGFG